MQREARVAKLFAGGQLVDRENFGRRAGRLLGAGRKGLVDRPADDHLDDLGIGEVGDGSGRNVAAVSEHGEVVAEGAHLAYAMRDEDHGHAIRLEPGDDVAEPVDVTAGERRGRLVEEKNARLAIDRPGDLDLLLDREVEVANLVVEVDIEAECVEMSAKRDFGGALPDHRRRPNRRIREEHVVENGQIADQRHLLERGLDAKRVRGARGAEAAEAAGNLEVAPIGLDQTGEQLDDRRFAGAVLAEEGVNGTRRDTKRDIIDRNRGAERFAQPLDRDRRSAGRLRHLPSSRSTVDCDPYNGILRPLKKIVGQPGPPHELEVRN